MTLYLDRKKFSEKSKDELLDELEKKYDELNQKDEELERLKKELRKYKNPNTPPSANQHLKPDAQPLKRKRKRGAPVGHPGTTRAFKEPDEERFITQDECPNGHSNLTVTGIETRIIEELPADIQTKNIRVTRQHLHCNDCGVDFIARDGRTPVQGRFGVNVMVFVIFLKFIVRGVLRKTASFLETGFAFKVTPATVNVIISRAAQAAEAEYVSLQQKIRSARIVYADETSFSVLGVKWWVWVFRTDTDVLLVIRHSRGNKVLEEVLGKQFSGVIVCDCWRAYDYLSNASIQRCWAHLLRKSKELESLPGRRFHHKLALLFERIERFNARPRTKEQRSRKYEQLTKSLRELTVYYSHYAECEAVAKYVDFHVESWFTCVRFEGVEATNNFAEQAIRETVIVRKIIGAFRSERGTKVYETLASLLATWQFQKLDVSKELYRMLSAGLC
ncbi:Transposase IS66 family protein [uncultured archaeon]|nr:Transposase IS66 family protein [uncultured archaeon]